MLGLWWTFGASPSVQAAPLRVAAASSTQEALEELARAFERQRGTRVQFSFASSGKLYHQIVNGAPFALFFSADATYPARLESAGRTRLRRRFGFGHLVLWIPEGSPLDPSRGLIALTDPGVRRVAIANPKLAPFGSAAVEALRASGAYPFVSSKLVYGENVAQAAHFVVQGGADAGLLPLSLARSPKLRGTSADVPGRPHAPLPAEAVLLKDAADTSSARDFLEFCLSEAGAAVWRKHGWGESP